MDILWFVPCSPYHDQPKTLTFAPGRPSKMWVLDPWGTWKAWKGRLVIEIKLLGWNHFHWYSYEWHVVYHPIVFSLSLNLLSDPYSPGVLADLGNAGRNTKYPFFNALGSSKFTVSIWIFHSPLFQNVHNFKSAGNGERKMWTCGSYNPL